MKSKPEKKPVPAVPTSATERSSKKKVLLFTQCSQSAPLLIREIKKGDHTVVEIVDNPDKLFYEIARTTPRLLVAHTLSEFAGDHLIRTQIPGLFPDLGLCLIQGDLSTNPNGWQQAIHISLAQPNNPPIPREYADRDRVVCHDESLMALSSGKLNRPERKDGWEKICSNQEARFLLELQTARKNHPAAKHYFKCLLKQQAGLDQELAYRLLHGSYKALSWSRDLAIKWLALLAHYVPDAEVEYLPMAGKPGPAIDFVHHDMSTEGVYAATLILCSKVKLTVAEAIKQAVTARFDGQDDDTLLALSLKLYGLAKLLEQVGRAQIELMDVWLDPSTVNRVDDADNPRGEHRNAGIYRDFHDLGFIIQSPEPLTSILRGFHAGTTRVEERRYLPSFAEFRRLTHGRTSPDQSAKD